MPDFPPLSPHKTDMLRAVRHVALDMDGTIYKGGTLFPFTSAFLRQLTKSGITHSFLTNNSSKSVAEYGEHLRGMGLRSAAEEIHISTHAVIGYLRSRHPAVRRVFTLASPGMDAELRAAGLELTADSPGDEPDAVIVGFDLDLSSASSCSLSGTRSTPRCRASSSWPPIRTSSAPRTSPRCSSTAERSARRSPPPRAANPTPCPANRTR